MIKGLLFSPGNVWGFQAPKERGKGSEVNFLEEQTVPIRSQGWAGAPPHPALQTVGTPYVETSPQKWRKPRGEDGALEPEQGAGDLES